MELTEKKRKKKEGDKRITKNKTGKRYVKTDRVCKRKWLQAFAAKMRPS